MMAEVKTEASSVQAKLKSTQFLRLLVMWSSHGNVCYTVHIDMERGIEEEQRGSGRHSTELRIRKAQVSFKNLLDSVAI